MTPEESKMLVQIHTAIFGSDGKGGCWTRGEKTAKDFYSFRLAVIVAGALFFGGSGFGFAKILELVGR